MCFQKYWLLLQVACSLIFYVFSCSLQLRAMWCLHIVYFHSFHQGHVPLHNCYNKPRTSLYLNTSLSLIVIKFPKRVLYFLQSVLCLIKLVTCENIFILYYDNHNITTTSRYLNRLHSHILCTKVHNFQTNLILTI